MSDLTRFRDHCRKMAAAEHRLDCPHVTACKPYWDRWEPLEDGPGLQWRGPEPPWSPPACDGCLSDAEHALFRRLADEVDAYLAADPDVVLTPPADDAGLWETTTDPAAPAANQEDAHGHRHA